MIPVLNSTERAKLISRSKKCFANRGWSIGKIGDAEIDFTVEKGVLSAFVIGIDVAVLHRTSASELLDRIDATARFYKAKKNKFTIFVTNGDIIGIDFSKAYGNERAAIIKLLELDIIAQSDVETFDPAIQYDLRQLWLIKSSAKACVMIGERHIKQGSLDDAILWYEFATKAAKGFSFGHTRLIAALTDRARFNEAMEVAQSALEFSPKNPQLLRACEKIEIRRGDLAAAQKWRQLLEDSAEKGGIKERLASIEAATCSANVNLNAMKSKNVFGRIRSVLGLK